MFLIISEWSGYQTEQLMDYQMPINHNDGFPTTTHQFLWGKNYSYYRKIRI